jgi:DNA-binding SARP family transcriptional activator
LSASEEITRLIEESRSLERGGEVAAAIQRAQQARQLAQAQEDADGEAGALNALAYAHIRLGHYDQAQQFCALALALAGGESSARAEALLNSGICAGETDDMPASEKFTQQAIDLSRQIGHDRVLVRGLHALACGIYMPRGQFALSLAVDEEALNIARARGLQELTWGPLLTMSWVHWLSGQPVLAEARLNELRLVVSPGSLGDGYWHFIHASLALEAGDNEAARDLFTKTLSIAEANGIAENLHIAYLGMSRVNRAPLRLGRIQDAAALTADIGQPYDAPAALAWAGEALTIAERTGYHHLQGQALIERGRASWALGDLAAAEADLRAAIARLAPQRLDFDLSTAWLLLAALLHQQKRSEAAAAWREAAVRLVQGGFAYLVDRERALSFPLIIAGLNSADSSIAEASTTLLEHLQRVPPPPLKITTFGGWRVQVGGRVVENQVLRQRCAGELLGLLLISPAHSISSDQVIDALWPDKKSAATQALFHHATSTLRRAFEPDLPEKFPSRYVEVSHGQVTLRLPPSSTIDYETFLAHYRRGEWEAALACYCADGHPGEFLPQYRYADWSISQRQWLAQDYQHALLEMAKSWLAEGRCIEALDACRKILKAEPWQEQAVLLGMHACLSLENYGGALRLYKTLEKKLHDELGIEPQAELQALYHSLIKQ